MRRVLIALCVLALAVAAAGVASGTAHAHYVGDCRGAKCKRHVVKPHRGWLASVRACEWSPRERWRTNTGNGFFGAYQFTLSSWRAVGGWGFPHRASPLEQSYRAVKLLHLQGRGAWPVCG